MICKHTLYCNGIREITFLEGHLDIRGIASGMFEPDINDSCY